MFPLWIYAIMFFITIIICSILVHTTSYYHAIQMIETHNRFPALFLWNTILNYKRCDYQQFISERRRGGGKTCATATAALTDVRQRNRDTGTNDRYKNARLYDIIVHYVLRRVVLDNWPEWTIIVISATKTTITMYNFTWIRSICNYWIRRRRRRRRP